MATYSLQLLNFPFDSKYLTGPMAHIALKTYTTHSFKVKSGKEIDFKLLSPECVTFNELEYQVDRLIKELEKIKKKGNLFFQKEKEKRRKYKEAKKK